jgi:hypothetical protein
MPNGTPNSGPFTGGAFEREVANWVVQLRGWIVSHERFTWITLLLSVGPSPFAAICAAVLAGVQLRLVARDRIPSSERRLLIIALVLSVLNLFTVAIAIAYVVRSGLSFWQALRPFWWFQFLFHRLFTDAIPSTVMASLQKG